MKNKCAVFGYFGDELEHIKINGRDVECIPIYRFSALSLRRIKKQATKLQALTYEQIIFDFFGGWLDIRGINSALITAYNHLIVDYAHKNKCTFRAAYDYLHNLEWYTLAALLDKKLNEWDIFFYAHGSTVAYDDWQDAAKVGILLISSFKLAELKELN